MRLTKISEFKVSKPFIGLNFKSPDCIAFCSRLTRSNFLFIASIFSLLAFKLDSSKVPSRMTTVSPFLTVDPLLTYSALITELFAAWTSIFGIVLRNFPVVLTVVSMENVFRKIAVNKNPNTTVNPARIIDFLGPAL